MSTILVFSAAVIVATLFTAAFCMLSTQMSEQHTPVVIPIQTSQPTTPQATASLPDVTV